MPRNTDRRSTLMRWLPLRNPGESTWPNTNRTTTAATATGDARSGQGFTLNSVAAAVIGGIAFSGGKGNFVGAVIGGIILGLLINIIYFANITSFYQVFTKGAIILVALLIGAVPRLRRELSHR